MLKSIKKEVLVTTVLFVVVLGIILYNSLKMFNIYDLVYLFVFIPCYIKYLRIKVKQKNYSKI